LASRRHVGQEHADLTVVDFPQPPSPLPRHAAGSRPRLGKGAGVQDQYGVRVTERLGHVAAQLGHDGFVIPTARADEVLHWFALATGLVGDWLRSLALQV